MIERIRYRIWSWVIRDPRVCNATSYSRIVWAIRDAGLLVGPSCYEGTGPRCWCGKVEISGGWR